jgi:osmotically-inducible protein OsmY
MKTSVRFSRLIIPVCLAVLGLTAVSQPALAQEGEMPDNIVKTVLEYRLIKDSLLKDKNIQVFVANRTITLEGTVPTIEGRQQAERDARKVAESYKIVNNLTLAPVQVSDLELQRKVEDAIRKHTFYNIFDWVDVAVNNGTVTLTGWVHQSWHEPEYAREAGRVPGVKKVVDQIQLLPVSFTDDELRHRIASLIYNQPIYQGYAYNQDPPIHIIVNNRVVTLIGTVLSDSDRNYLYNLVYLNTDAYDVIDDLKVAG